MKILVVTNSCSNKKYTEICKIKSRLTIDPQQKFFSLLIDGFSENPKIKVEVVSILPLSASTAKKYIFPFEKEKTKLGANYNYISFINGKFSRYFSLFVSSIKFIKNWCEKNKGEKSYLIVDPLIPVVTIPVRKIAQKYGIKVIALVTDLPTLTTEMKKYKESKIKKFFLALYQNIASKDLGLYDAYITLTESINEVINLERKPYIVIEGFADSKDKDISDISENYIMYAGGIYEKYGLKNLVEAFIKLRNKNVELYIFGEGSYTEELKKVQENNSNIKYMGYMPAERIVEYEKKALLLVNPRPINEEFSKYSFPSKTIEYMLSGTAVVSTKLQGIPKEYFEYIYTFNGDSVLEIQETLEKILSYSKKELKSKGISAHKFILENKNNIKMASKIISFIEKNLNY